MKLLVVAVILIAPGCDKAFGLYHDDDQMPGEASVDASQTTVTGTWMNVYATNDAAGNPTLQTIPQPHATLTFVTDTTDPITAELDATGVFSFERPPNAPYRIMLDDGSGNVPLELQHTAPALQLATRMAGRPDRVPITLMSRLTFSMHAIAGGRVIHSTGLWTETGMAADVLDWKLAGSRAGPLGLLDAAKNDRLYYVVREPAMVGPNSYTAVEASASAPVTIVNGVDQTVPIAPVQHALDRCTMLLAKRSNDLARLRAAAPATATVNSFYILVAAPVQDIGPVGALSLAYQFDTTATDAQFTVSYFNPFPDHSVLASMGALVTRSYQLPGGTPASVNVSDQLWAPAPDCTNQVILQQTQGIPDAIKIGGRAIAATDGGDLSVAVATRQDLTWTVAPSVAPNDVSVVTILEVGVMGTATTLTPIASYETTSHTVSLPPGRFVANHYYVIRIDGTLGFPEAGSGDLRTVQYPFSSVSQFSSMFHAIP